MSDEMATKLTAARTVDIHQLAIEMCRTSFELVINPITGACLIVNRHTVREPTNVLNFPHEGQQLLNAYIKMTTEAENTASDFAQGQRDCSEGVPHAEDRSESYDRGYAVQYELEQIKGATK